MSDVVRYTPDELGNIEKQFRYTVFGQGITIFIADSSVARRRTLMNDIKKAGFDMVEDASKTLELQKKLQKCATPSIAVVLDLSLPKIKPGDFIRTALSSVPDAVFIVTHEKAGKDLIAQSVDSGALAVMERPYSSQDVIDKLAAFGIQVKA